MQDKEIQVFDRWWAVKVPSKGDVEMIEGGLPDHHSESLE